MRILGKSEVLGILTAAVGTRPRPNSCSEEPYLGVEVVSCQTSLSQRTEVYSIAMC